MTPRAISNHQAIAKEEQEKKVKQFEEDTIESFRALDHQVQVDFTEAMQKYIGRGYQEINPLLRSTTSTDLETIEKEAIKINAEKPPNQRVDVSTIMRTIKNLEKGFRHFSTKESLTVYRRASGAVVGFPPSDKGNPLKKALADYKGEGKKWIADNITSKFKKGDIFTDRGYLSTSFSGDFVGSSFSNSSVHFEISVPPGTRGLTITPKLFVGFSEKEFLLDRAYGMEIKEIAVSPIDGSNRLIIKGAIIANNHH